MDETRNGGSMVALTSLSRLVYRAATDDILGMRLKEFHLLSLLREQDGLVLQQDLGRAMHIDANNLVLMLNGLESDGYVERRRDPQDRRRHIVAITSAGRRAVARSEDALESIEDQVLTALNAQERATLKDLLERALEGSAVRDLPNARLATVKTG